MAQVTPLNQLIDRVYKIRNLVESGAALSPVQWDNLQTNLHAIAANLNVHAQDSSSSILAYPVLEEVKQLHVQIEAALGQGDAAMDADDMGMSSGGNNNEQKTFQDDSMMQDTMGGTSDVSSSAPSSSSGAGGMDVDFGSVTPSPKTSAPMMKGLPTPPVNSDPYSKYQIVRTLKETIYGKVKLGVLTANQQMQVAIKLSDMASIQSMNALENPDEEIKVMHYLSQGGGHANVLKLVDVCRDRRYHWTVMEFCSGGEFFEIIAKNGRLTDQAAKYYFKELVKGVAYMHSKRIIHLDLSLENMLLDGSRHLKICDFGMARLVTDSVGNFPGEPGCKPGKLGYMAPEIYAGSSFNGYAADVYSIGCILFIMLTGIPPYDTPSSGDARFAMIFQGQLAQLLQRWGLLDKLDANAVQLLQAIFAPPQQRITTAQILQHPWLK